MFNWLKKKPSENNTDVVAKPSPDTVPDTVSETVSGTVPDTISGVGPEAGLPPACEPRAETIPAATPKPVSAAAPEPSPDATTAPAAKPAGGLFQRLKKGLTRTRQLLNTNVEDLFKGRTALDDDLLEELEELLITADVGVGPATALIDQIKKRSGEIRRAQDLQRVIKEELAALLQPCEERLPLWAQDPPHVIMVVGVNGVGKTTTIGKLAARYQRQQQKVLIAAADTFRAAAVEQLATWADRAGADLVKHKPQADPAAVAFDGVAAARARSMDVAIIDTAGRLHTKVNLMEELKKIRRAIAKKIPEAPHEVLLVLDATTGQNAISQARLFHEALGVTGIALTKLDGTAKGGIVISICQTLKLPLQYIGVGEQVDDLQDFNAADFVKAMF